MTRGSSTVRPFRQIKNEKKETTCHNKYLYSEKVKPNINVKKFRTFIDLQNFKSGCVNKKTIHFQTTLHHTTPHQITYSIEFFCETFLQRLI